MLRAPRHRNSCGIPSSQSPVEPESQLCLAGDPDLRPHCTRSVSPARVWPSRLTLGQPVDPITSLMPCSILYRTRLAPRAVTGMATPRSWERKYGTLVLVKPGTASGSVELDGLKSPGMEANPGTRAGKPRAARGAPWRAACN